MIPQSIGRTFLLSTALLALSGPLLSAAVPPPRPWPANPFEPLTAERVSALPAAEQPAWRAYWDESARRAGQAPSRKGPDFSPLTPLSGPPKGGAHTKGLRLNAPEAWYASDEARAIADHVVAAQSPEGAWTKGIDYINSANAPAKSGNDLWSGGTFDNDATIRELQFLARVAAAAGDDTRRESWHASFLHGLAYCFAAQYPNGGFPQIYPLVGGYHDAITFNDDAMTNVLELLRDIAGNQPEYAFVPAALRAEAAQRFARGITCVLATQYRDANGNRTAWCQQYDALTLAPCAARNFEPIAACAGESASLLTLLMSVPQPSPEIIAAVDSGIAWLQRTALHDVVWTRSKTDGTGLTETPGAPALWARFCEFDTWLPIFGDRDRTIHYAVTEISPERRLGYAWYGTWPARVIEAHHAWRRALAANTPSK